MTARLEDIHNKSLEERARSAMAAESRQLAARIDEFVDTACPACTSPRRELAFRVHGFHHQRCLECRMLYISPCPTDAHVLEYLETSEGLRIWREEMPAETHASRRPMYQKRLQAVLKIAQQFGVEPRTVVEIGGGNGEFAREAVDVGAFEKLIIAEPQPLEINLPNVEVVAGSFDEIDLKGTADMVLAFEVFEHIVDPDRFLAMARRSLRPGGILFMSTPSVDGFEITTLGENSYTIPFDHVRLYNPLAIRKVLERSGFEVLAVETPGDLDVQILHRTYEAGDLDLSSNPALRFLLEDGYEYQAEFQEFLRKNLLSGHMRCAARLVEA